MAGARRRLGIPAAKWALAGCCVYEAAAITTGRVPTFTEISSRHPWLKRVLVEALAIHLNVPEEGARP